MSAINQYVSTAQVAQALGVSVTTVKRWVDDRVLPAHRTVGGHRKLLMSDVVRLVRDGNLPQADLSRLVPKAAANPHDPQQLYKQLVEVIDAADVDLVRSIVHGGYRSGVPVEVLADKVVAPALNHVGTAWECGRMTVMHEHRVSQACVAVLYELRAELRANAERGRPVAVGGAPEGDGYVVPSLLAELCLLDAGWDAVNLGPQTPLSAVRAAVEELAPRLVWLSVSHLPADADGWLAEYAELYRLAEGKGAAVAVGGRGLTPDVRGRMPYTMHGDGLSQLTAFARSLYRRPQRPKRGRPPGSKASAGPGG